MVIHQQNSCYNKNIEWAGNMTDLPEYIKIENRIIHNSESNSKFKDRFGIQYKEKF